MMIGEPTATSEESTTKKKVKRMLSVNLKLCKGHKACEVACAVEHSSSKDPLRAASEEPPPVTRIVVKTTEKGHVPIFCRQCAKAPCVEVCPTNAIYQTEDGVKRVKEMKCIGCWSCTIVCPFGAIQIDWERGIIAKCDLCPDRLSKGLPTACEEACPEKAIRLK
ncbi:4Fe-4S binding protein [Thermodesulfovibrionales bacterium]|nr:4Fe-4S binding protein [Thermodesulfovibrionales bacterium]MCL0061635.1 4Fe-4S binding protein [Thermodesulfovibrionales bacterium]